MVMKLGFIPQIRTQTEESRTWTTRRNRRIKKNWSVRCFVIPNTMYHQQIFSCWSVRFKIIQH